MLRPSTVWVSASLRRASSEISRQSHRLRVRTERSATGGRCGGGWSGRASSFETPSPSHGGATLGPFDVARRRLSAGRGLNGEAPPSSVIDSSAATARWKREHYRKIEDKFPPAGESGDREANAAKTAATSSAKRPVVAPLAIDNYEDVQPMWKEMESRVTRRRSLTHEQRGGVSGRRNVRKSDEDVWLEAGVYENSDDLKKE